MQLSKMFGHTHHYYLDAFKKYGLYIRSNKENSRKYVADFQYFHEIDSHEKAYWLGFMYADGYVSNASNRKKVGVTLAEQDIEQLQKLKVCLRSTYPIKKYKTKGYYHDKEGSCVRLLIENDDMYNDLVFHGVVPHKSNVLKAPNIDSIYTPSFILGYFDGDGSIFLNNAKYPFYSINIVGTDDVLTYIHAYIKSIGATNKDVHLEKRRSDQIVSYIRYGGNVLVENIMSHLYAFVDVSLPLERKYSMYLKCKNRTF